MKVVVDFDLCESNGVCVDVCPEVFYFDDQDFHYVREENVPAENRAALEEAVSLCPRSAIKLVE